MNSFSTLLAREDQMMKQAAIVSKQLVADVLEK